MDRFTISLSEDLAAQFDELIQKKSYQNRSEAVRDMLRNELESARLERHEAPNCVASLSHVYSHHARDLHKVIEQNKNAPELYSNEH